MNVLPLKLKSLMQLKIINGEILVRCTAFAIQKCMIIWTSRYCLMTSQMCIQATKLSIARNGLLITTNSDSSPILVSFMYLYSIILWVIFTKHLVLSQNSRQWMRRRSPSTSKHLSSSSLILHLFQFYCNSTLNINGW